MGLEFSPPAMQRRPTPEDLAEAERLRRQECDHDRTLVVQLQAGEVQALEALMARYASRLARFAFYTVGSQDAAEDIVQQVFIQIWERRATLIPDSHLKAYLFRLVRNRAFDERKALAVRERYRMTVQAEANAGIVGAFVPNPEDSFLTDFAIQTALEQLSERRRQALLLRFKEAMTHAEIAEALDVSLVTAQNLVARAVNDLRKGPLGK